MASKIVVILYNMITKNQSYQKKPTYSWMKNESNLLQSEGKSLNLESIQMNLAYSLRINTDKNGKKKNDNQMIN